MLFAAVMVLAMQDAPPVEQAPDAPPGSTVSKPVVAADGTQRWSILVDPCASVDGGREEIVVCGSAMASSPRLPLPAERGPPDRPMPSNPYLSGSGALASAAAPCATLSQGCTTGLNLFGGGTALIRLIQKLVSPGSCCETPGEATNPVALVSDIATGVRRNVKGKPDRRNRVAIPLDDLRPEREPAPAPAAQPGVQGPL